MMLLNQDFHFGTLGGQHYTSNHLRFRAFFIFSSGQIPTAPEEARPARAGSEAEELRRGFGVQSSQLLYPLLISVEARLIFLIAKA
jgi:hypothetical protein